MQKVLPYSEYLDFRDRLCFSGLGFTARPSLPLLSRLKNRLSGTSYLQAELVFHVFNQCFWWEKL